MESNPTPSGGVFGVSCKSPTQGAYCHQCGEKRIDPQHDFNMFYFFRETLEQYLNFDGKVLRSFKQFFIQPGSLTLAWMQGRRKAYMKPLILFLTVAVAVHFFLPTTNVYFEIPWRPDFSNFQHYSLPPNHYCFDRCWDVGTSLMK